MKLTDQQWTAALDAVLTKANHDAAFRFRCDSDPAGAFQEATGHPLPEDRAAALLASLRGELSDEHLDRVAGGYMDTKNPNSPFDNP